MAIYLKPKFLAFHQFNFKLIRIYILKNKNNYKKHQEIFSQCFIFLSLNLIIIYNYNIFSLKIHLIYTIYPIFPFTNAPNFTINIITIKATIIARPYGMLKIYENNNPNNIPKNENKGKVEIEYYSKEDLERLYDLLEGKGRE